VLGQESEGAARRRARRPAFPPAGRRIMIFVAALTRRPKACHYGRLFVRAGPAGAVQAFKPGRTTAVATTLGAAQRLPPGDLRTGSIEIAGGDVAEREAAFCLPQRRRLRAASWTRPIHSRAPARINRRLVAAHERDRLERRIPPACAPDAAMARAARGITIPADVARRSFEKMMATRFDCLLERDRVFVHV